MDWRHHAACLEQDPELFFPIGSSSSALAQAEAAKRICQSCSVREVCLKWALDTNQDAGVWGGMSEDERRLIRRRALNRR
ncbi:MAG: WhiB family transcriptional regulator [Arcanobacterium sp.]|nr:WhiB family transcriptional regulator [Arcanobacterium sp.]